MAEKRGQNLKLEKKYVFLSLLAGALYYAAYHLNVPNSYSLLVSLIFLTVFIKNFNKVEAVSIIIYFMIFTAAILPKTVYLLSGSMGYKLGMLALNLLILALVSYGVYNVRKWGSVLTILVSLLSSYLIATTVISVVTQKAFSASILLFILRNVSSVLMSFAIIVFLLTFWKKFK